MPRFQRRSLTEKAKAKDAANDCRTLDQALRATCIARWQGRRCYSTSLGQATIAVDALSRRIRKKDGRPPEVRDVTPAVLSWVVNEWWGAGASPATINKRLTCLSSMGVDVSGFWRVLPRTPKWWLTIEMQAQITARLRAESPTSILADFIDWTAWTGLRVEESLRLTRADFSDGFTLVTVPGTKTARSHCTLPISDKAAALAASIFAPDAPLSAVLFRISYSKLASEWRKARLAVGVTHPGATLKALRRSAARHLTVNGMPLDILRQYLRHDSIATTMEYLRLVGGYGSDELRRWLPRE